MNKTPRPLGYDISYYEQKIPLVGGIYQYPQQLILALQD